MQNYLFTVVCLGLVWMVMSAASDEGVIYVPEGFYGTVAVVPSIELHKSCFHLFKNQL